MITAKNLMALERFLLEIENRFKFQLRFAEVIELYGFLKEVGKITNIFFMLQEQYAEKYKDKEALKEYHEKLINDSVNLNVTKMVEFVKDVSNRFYDDEFADIITKNQFWD